MDYMKEEELINILQRGEDSFHQFKENLDSPDKLAVEISAFANSLGGRIIVGVNDKGEITGISGEDIRRLNQWISNTTCDVIEPPLFVNTQILQWREKKVLIIDIPMGKNKPYSVYKTNFWVKNGADKRRASREELFRLMQSSSFLYADETETGAGMEELDEYYFRGFYEKYYEEKWENSGIPLAKLLKNLKLMKGEQLTLAGLLLFGKNPRRHKPPFIIKATYFDGMEITQDNYRDMENISGKLIEQFQQGISFITRNLRRIQRGDSFNYPPTLEIPEKAIREAVANAVAHRDYFINAPIFINLFPDRLEISSPGTLPNTITEENIIYGIHVQRNPIILSFLEKEQDFEYSGRGTGIPRLIKKCKEFNIKYELINDKMREQFRVVFHRP